MKRPALALVVSAFLAVALAQAAPPTQPATGPAVPATEVQPLPEPDPAPPVQPVPDPGLPDPGLPDLGLPEIPAEPPAPQLTPPLLVPAPLMPVPPPQPAPVVPKPGVKTPAQPAPLPASALTLVLDVPLKLLQGGKPVTGGTRQSFVIAAERAAALRQGGAITASLEQDLRAFASKVSARPQDAHFEEFPSGWALVERDGVTVDLDRSRASLLAALKNPASTMVALSFASTAPARTLNYFTSRGITAFLATGETNYYGSSRARISNIHTGASKFRDRLFEGQTFSFNALLGNISEAAGFVPGLVISGDRTATGVGGGICQVSSTVFRALYGAGLSLVERRNHSYQVHYYDPQGLDATIYQPSQDLKFANDTGGAMWFQTDWDDAQARLSVHVFGQPRDYAVSIGRPVTLRTTPSPANRLIPDATMPAGQRRQIDWAAPGAVVRVTRSFSREGKVFKTDTLNSSYVPWPNIFMVGTKQ